jgi:hypothetical protein
LLSHIKAPLREEKREAANCLIEMYQKKQFLSNKSVDLNQLIKKLRLRDEFAQTEIAHAGAACRWMQ